MTTQKTIVCADCGANYTYTESPGFPRKYCSDCSVARKAAYDNKPQITNEAVAKAVKDNVERTYKAPTGDKFTTMYVSYTKDIFCSEVKFGENINQRMDMAIAIVKQAKEAFE